MATYTSQRSGNWNDDAANGSSPWNGGGNPASGVPGSGDLAVVSSGHTVTIPDGYSAVVGNSPGAAGVVLTVNGTGALVVGGGASGSLRALGSVLFSDSANALTVNAGGTLFLDGTGNVGQAYTLGVGALTRVRFSGAASARVTVKSTTSAGATPAVVVPGNGSYSGGVLASYTDFQYLGSSAAQAWMTAMNQNYGGTPADDWLFVFDRCTFDHCGEFYGVAVNACVGCRFEVTRCAGTNGLTTGNDAGVSWSFRLAPHDAPSGGGTYLFTDNSFDTQPRFFMVDGATITGNYLGRGAYIASQAFRWAAFTRNFVRHQDALDSDTLYLHGDTSDCYLFADALKVDNWHAVYLTAAPWTLGDVTAAGAVFDGPFVTDPTDGGEMFLPDEPGSARTFTVRNCLVLPSASNKSGQSYLCPLGTLVAVTHASATSTNASFVVDHNTVCGNYSFAFGETGNVPRTGELAEYRANLLYSPSSSAPTWHVKDVPGTYGVNDPLATGQGNHNAGFNLGAGHGSNPSGYDYLATVAPGASDVALGTGTNFQTGGPKFLDPTRNMATWAVAQGYASSGATLAAKVNAGLAAIQADPSLTSSSLLPYVRAGFRPINTALLGASYPTDPATTDAAGNSYTGSTPDIGAMAWTAQPAATFTVG